MNVVFMLCSFSSMDSFVACLVKCALYFYDVMITFYQLLLLFYLQNQALIFFLLEVIHMSLRIDHYLAPIKWLDLMRIYPSFLIFIFEFGFIDQIQNHFS